MRQAGRLRYENFDLNSLPANMASTFDYFNRHILYTITSNWRIRARLGLVKNGMLTSGFTVSSRHRTQRLH